LLPILLAHSSRLVSLRGAALCCAALGLWCRRQSHGLSTRINRIRSNRIIRREH